MRKVPENAAVGHGRLTRMVPLDAIKPHPHNPRLYKPVDPSDPEVRALADNIKKNGILEPLVLTGDFYILSGHRRHVAAKLAGLRAVPCRIDAVRSDDPGVLSILASYNQQRVKTNAMMLREELVLADPEEAHRGLVEYRAGVAQLDAADCIPLVGVKRRARITTAKEPFLDAIKRILANYEKFLPLTVRQVHYALLNDPPLRHANKPESRYANDRKSYGSLTELLARARLTGLVPFSAIHDATRPVAIWEVYNSVQPFLRKELNRLFKGYRRNVLQSQPNHIEIVGEKNTIESIIRPVAHRFGITYTIGRGYASLEPRYKIQQRYAKSGKEKLILLFLSDFDPEGEDIAHSFARSLRDDFGVESANIHPVKVALTFDQVRAMQLAGLGAGMKKSEGGQKAKKDSSRRKGFVEKHGEQVYELEAIKPEQLQAILREVIVNVLSIDALNREIDREKQDAAFLDAERRRACQMLEGVGDFDNAN